MKFIKYIASQSTASQFIQLLIHFFSNSIVTRQITERTSLQGC